MGKGGNGEEGDRPTLGCRGGEDTPGEAGEAHTG